MAGAQIKKQPPAPGALPWGYGESLLLVAALVLFGLALQLIIGPFDWSLLPPPGNRAVAGALVALAALSWPWRRRPWLQWLSGPALAATLIAGLGLGGLIMGLTLQAQEPPAGPDRGWPGFDRMTSCWPFVFLYLATLASLALVLARRWRPWRPNMVFWLNHAGLWLLLAAGGLGAAERQSYLMYVPEGQTEWRVAGGPREIIELPLALRLNHLIIGPERLASDLTVYAPEGREKSAVVEINKPLRTGGWIIYQHSYNQMEGNRAGQPAAYSGLELVYDPWLPWAYLGLGLLGGGALGLLIRGGRAI